MRGSPAILERDAKIAALRVKGHTPSVIARHMDVSKHVVAGVLFRAGLVSPRKERAPRKSHAERAAITAANKLKKAMKPDIAAAPRPQRQRGTGLLAGPTLPAVVVPPAPAPAFQRRTSRLCCWPIWPDSERARPPIFCGQSCAANRVYCSAHCQIAYVPYKPYRPREIADAT